jgi:hypothetical protein
MADLLEIEARISALELVLVTQILHAGVGTAGFDPKAFAASRRDAWASIGQAMCTDCASDADEDRFTRAYAAALERIGHLMVTISEPIQEAIDEVDAALASLSRREDATVHSPGPSDSAS